MVQQQLGPLFSLQTGELQGGGPTFSTIPSTLFQMPQGRRGVSDFLGVQGWGSGESTLLPPMWPGFDSQTQCHMWVEFVGSLLCTKRFPPGTLVSPLLKNQHLT